MTDKVRILIVDDLPFNRRVLRLLLRHPAVEIVGEAENGREALHLIDQQALDLVLMDVKMPEMNGIEATRRIKQTRPELKVLVSSMIASYEADALAAGADQFVPKQYGLTTICDTVLDLVRPHDPFHSTELIG